jgi:AcrR family transcriptional regulator
VPRRPVLTADRVIDVAADLADREGYANLTLGKVAAKLGVRTPSLYNHLDGLEDLRRRLAVRALAALGDELQRAAVGRSSEDAVRAIAVAYRRFAHAHPGLYATTVPSTEGTEEAIQQAGDAMLRTVLAALSGYGLSEEEAIHATRSVRSAVHGFISLELAGGFGLPAEVDASFEWLIGLLARGLRARANG